MKPILEPETYSIGFGIKPLWSWSNESAAIRNGLFSKNHINSKKNRRKKLNSPIDRKLNVEFRKNSEKFWKKS